MSYHQTIESLVKGQIHTSMNPSKRHYWPRFAFHFTDINNAVNILTSGKLVSRDIAIRTQLMPNDNASREVINQTDNFIEKNVRLYFRPRTPTQFYSEGFQTRDLRRNLNFHANCPVPIFFLFDLESLLERPDVQFSTLSLAIKDHGKLMSTAEEFAALPFDDIYSDGFIEGDNVRRKEVTRRKHAEILVPNELDLSKLRMILVRSEAEKATFLHLLHERNINRFDSMIQIGDESTFYKDRNYIDKVSLQKNQFILENRTNVPFPKEWGNPGRVEGYLALVPANKDSFLNVRITFQRDNGSEEIEWPKGENKGIFKNKMAFKVGEPQIDYTVSVYIDDHIAYRGKFESQFSENLPF